MAGRNLSTSERTKSHCQWLAQCGVVPTTHAMREWYLLGLPGPTHVHAGIARGNVASAAHRDQAGSPRLAALQVVAYARALLSCGVAVAVLPPLPRPDREFLHAVGLDQDPGRDADVLKCAGSSAFMWAANAATVIPAADRGGSRALVIPANLAATSHRALETAGRTLQLRALLDDHAVAVRAPWPALVDFADEGAANHHRAVSSAPGGTSVHVVVHGRAAGVAAGDLPQRFPARQSDAVGRALARVSGVDVLTVRQHPGAVDAGAFHNDVVMVGTTDRILIHAQAWVDQAAALHELRRRIPELQVAEVAAADLPLAEAVRSYLFNSVLIDQPSAAPLLMAPAECGDGAAAQVIGRLRDCGFISAVRLVALRESMMGGGGPACLRLRVVVPAAAVHSGAVLSHERCDLIDAVIRAHWPERLTPRDLADPHLAEVDAAARMALDRALGLPVVFS